MIYDCFTFFNELDLLEIRLNELDPFVDYFVLVEASFTHQGQAKPFYFEEYKNRFSTFYPKIIHIKVEDMPDISNKTGTALSWILENYQRNAISRGLQNTDQEDIVLISDIDEIPSATKLKEHLSRNKIKVFKQRFYYYFLNCIRMKNKPKWQKRLEKIVPFSLFRKPPVYSPENLMYWKGTVMVPCAQLKKPQELRNNRENPEYIDEFIEEGGWHFSFMGGVEKIIEKLEAYAHAEFNKEELKQKEKLKSIIHSGHCFHNKNVRLRFITIDNSYPQYLIDHKKQFSHLIME